MATIGTTGHGKRGRAIEFEVPLLPIIDLLLCCVMFLLATAVWNKVAALEAEQSLGSDAEAVDDSEPPPVLVVRRASFAVRDATGMDAEVPDGELAGVLGLTLEQEAGSGGEATPFVELLVKTRADLRSAKQYALADQLRKELAALGVVLEDTPGGTVWRWDQ